HPAARPARPPTAPAPAHATRRPGSVPAGGPDRAWRSRSGRARRTGGGRDRRRGRPSKAPRNEQEEGAEQGEHQRRAEKVGYAEDPHLGDGGLEQGEQQGANADLDEIEHETNEMR